MNCRLLLYFVEYYSSYMLLSVTQQYRIGRKLACVFGEMLIVYFLFVDYVHGTPISSCLSVDLIVFYFCFTGTYLFLGTCDIRLLIVIWFYAAGVFIYSVNRSDLIFFPNIECWSKFFLRLLVAHNSSKKEFLKLNLFRTWINCSNYCA